MLDVCSLLLMMMTMMILISLEKRQRRKRRQQNQGRLLRHLPRRKRVSIDIPFQLLLYTMDSYFFICEICLPYQVFFHSKKVKKVVDSEGKQKTIYVPLLQTSLICFILLCPYFVGGKSSVLMDVKPWDDETDMKKLEEAVRGVQMEGLLWGACMSCYFCSTP